MLTYFAAEAAHAAEVAEAHGAESGGILGLSPSAFVIQLITFLLVFIVLKKFAFNRIVKMLEKRRETIDDGVRMGLRMEKEKAKLDEQVAETLRKARHEADQIIAAAHKESREITREAEKAGRAKADAMFADMEERLEEEAAQARRNLEKELVGLVSEATETIVGEKIDPNKDAELVRRAMKGRK